MLKTSQEDKDYSDLQSAKKPCVISVTIVSILGVRFKLEDG